MNLKEIVGTRIRYFRNKRDLTQEELAFRSQLHNTYIAQIELGKRSCSFNSLNKISTALKVPADSLLRTSDKTAGSNNKNINKVITLLENKKDHDIEMVYKIILAVFQRDRKIHP